MPATRWILDRVLSIADPTVDRAMAAALGSCQPKEAAVMTAGLLERHHPDGLLGVVLHYHRLPGDAQQAVTEHAGDLFAALRQAATRPQAEGHGPTNAVRIIQASMLTRLAYLVTELIRHGDDTLRNQAAQCLLEMAQCCATWPEHDVDRPKVDAAGAAYLQNAIEEAVQRYATHKHPTLLLALATLTPRATPTAMIVLGDADHPATQQVQRMLTRADQPATRRCLLQMLMLPAMCGAAIDGLRQCAEAGRLGEALENFHMLCIGRAARPLARMKTADSIWPGEAKIAQMSPRQQRGLASWAAALPVDRNVRIDMLTKMTACADSGARLMAVRRLADLSRPHREPDALQAVAKFAQDRHPAVATAALRHLIRGHHEGLVALLMKLVNAGHEEVRQLAGRHLAPIGFARLWEQWPKLAPEQRLAAGRALIKIDPDLHRQLGEKLELRDQQTRLRALSMITLLNQGEFFEPALDRLARDSDEKVASAAVRALGTAASESAAGTLMTSLEHGDARVRANAVEALERLQSTQHVHRLVEMAEADEHRPRVSAIKALMQMKTGDALHALSKMLHDKRSMHRASALWLVESMGLLEVARQVAEMSLSDPDRQVKTRADHVIHGLIDMMKQAPPGDPLTGDSSPAA